MNRSHSYIHTERDIKKAYQNIRLILLNSVFRTDNHQLIVLPS